MSTQASPKWYTRKELAAYLAYRKKRPNTWAICWQAIAGLGISKTAVRAVRRELRYKKGGWL